MARKSLSETLHHREVTLRSEILEAIPAFFNALYGPGCSESTSVTEIRDHFRGKQISGKSWFYSRTAALELGPETRVLIIGGWLGFTAYILAGMGLGRTVDVDPDARTATIARHLNRFHPGYQRWVMDANRVDMADFDLIINTCTEHIESDRWFESIRPGAWVILQNTDWPESDHVNSLHTVEELSARYPLDLAYSGTLDLDQYRRFMTVGRKI